MNARTVGDARRGEPLGYVVETTGGWPVAHGQICACGSGCYRACPDGAVEPLPGVYATPDELLDHLAGRGEAPGGEDGPR